MSSKYDKQISMSHEEEGSYHRREVEHLPARPTEKNYTTTKTYHEVVPKRSDHHAVKKYGTSDEEDNFEEWTVSKRKVNHKTRQVETRVSRQLLVEDGKVIADSGPQVVTRIKEDNKEEECEKEKEPKNKSKFEALDNAPECDSSGRVLGEKRQITRVSREVREENMQYHDERFKELTGQDVHRRAIKAPHELITITDKDSPADRAPRGKMVHYSNKGKKYRDTDEVLEVAKLAIDGSVTKEVKRTKHHEEFSEDEKPDETGEAEVLRETGPTVSRSSRRHVDYVNDFDDASSRSSSDDEDARRGHRGGHKSHGYDHGHRARHEVPSKATAAHKTMSSPSHRRHHKNEADDPAFPRYEIDPLLNSLREEDYKTSPTIGYESPLSQRRSRGGHEIEHPVGRKSHSDSTSESDVDRSRHHHRHHHHSQHQHQHQHQHPHHQRSHAASQHYSPSPVGRGGGSHHGSAVEIPAEYRINKHQQHRGQGPKRTGSKSSLHERSYSPPLSHQHHYGSSRSINNSNNYNNTKQHHNKSSKSLHRSSHKEDASVQAHLTDEEEERKSTRSTSSSEITHEKQARHLQRQSTANSSRHYYYGDRKTHQRKDRRRNSVSSSSSSSSLDDQKERHRKHGTKSRDSGFKSPTYSDRISTPASMGAEGDKQIYSVSNKSKSAKGAASPSPSHRSVKTTTTSLQAGLADRPLSRQSRSSSQSKKTKSTQDKSAQADKYNEPHNNDDEQVHSERKRNRESTKSPTGRRQTDDNVSLSSLGHATTIKVPYKRIEIQHRDTNDYHSSDGSSDDTLVKEKYTSRGTEHHYIAPKGLEKHTTTTTTNKYSKQDSVEETSSVMTLQEDIASLNKRIESINKRSQGSSEPKKYYDHKEIVANIEPVPIKKQVINAYNVRVIEHKSPFHNEEQPLKTISDLSDTIARLELLSTQSDSGRGSSTLSADNNSAKVSVNGTVNINDASNVDNNNEINFNLSHFIKYKATPVIVEPSIALDGRIHSNDEDEEKRSVTSSCSLKSSRTYDIKSPAIKIDNKYIGLPDRIKSNQQNQRLEFDELGVEKKPKAWVFDPNNGASVPIVPPERPKPEMPKIDARTEELVQARGGRSYYVELVEPKKSITKPQRSSSIDPLYQRWSSQSALNITTNNTNSQYVVNNGPNQPVHVNIKSNRSESPMIKRQEFQNRSPASNNITSASKTNCSQQQQQQPTTLSRMPFANRYKSSPCLVGSTRSSKYSIYGGLRKPNDSGKPVPRLSYSRAIGPRLHRHVENQPKPSRYLKMK